MTDKRVQQINIQRRLDMIDDAIAGLVTEEEWTAFYTQMHADKAEEWGVTPQEAAEIFAAGINDEVADKITLLMTEGFIPLWSEMLGRPITLDRDDEITEEEEARIEAMFETHPAYKIRHNEIEAEMAELRERLWRKPPP